MKSNQPIIGLILMGITLFALAAMTSCSTNKGAIKAPEVKKISFQDLNKEPTNGLDAYILITPDSIRGENEEYIFYAYDENGISHPFITKNPIHYQVFKKKSDAEAIWLHGANIKPLYLWQDKIDSSINSQKLAEMDKREFFLIMGQRVISNDLLPRELRKKVLPTSSVVDSDGDGIQNKDDLEPNTQSGSRVDSRGVTAKSPVDPEPEKKEADKSQPKNPVPKKVVPKPKPVSSWPIIKGR